jgi:hypothetical protein
MIVWRIFLFAMIPAAAFAQSPDMVSPLIANHASGVICAPPTKGTSPAPGTVAGTTHLIDVEPAFVSHSRRVPAVLGIGFGIKALAVDISGIDDVLITISHPEMGDQKATAQSFGSLIRGTDPSLTFYQFDFDYELVTGIWQMEASRGTEILYRTTFEVVTPDQAPELATICGFENLLS